MFDFLLKPLGFILQQLSVLFNGSFAASVFVFTLIINLLMIPLSIKSQKSSMGQTRIKPKLDALREKYGNDRQKFAMAQQELMQQEGVSMSGGCLPMLIRMPIMLGIYYVILSPMTYIAQIGDGIIKAADGIYKGIEGVVAQAYNQPAIINLLQTPKQGEPVPAFRADFLEALGQKISADKLQATQNAVDAINFDFLGIDLTSKPEFNIDIFNHWHINWLIPILAFAAAMLTSILSMRMQKKNNPEAPSMGGLMLSMPLISLFIGFTVSCAAGFYWACSSLIAGLIQLAVQQYYGPNKMVAVEQKKELLARFEEEKKKKTRGEKA